MLGASRSTLKCCLGVVVSRVTIHWCAERKSATWELEVHQCESRFCRLEMLGWAAFSNQTTILKRWQLPAGFLSRLLGQIDFFYQTYWSQPRPRTLQFSMSRKAKNLAHGFHLFCMNSAWDDCLKVITFLMGLSPPIWGSWWLFK